MGKERQSELGGSLSPVSGHTADAGQGPLAPFLSWTSALKSRWRGRADLAANEILEEACRPLAVTHGGWRAGY